MKTIAELSGVDFLRRCNQIRHKAEEVLKNTNVLEIRKRKPIIKGTEKPEEIEALYDEQAKKNINDMLDLMLEEKPEETIKLFEMLVDVDKDEEKPSGMDLVLIGMSVLSDKRVLDFLASLMRLGQTSMGA